jgi:hypothetical protein
MKKLFVLISICCFLNGCIDVAYGVYSGRVQAQNSTCHRDQIYSFTQTRGGIKDVEHRLYYNIPCDPACKGYLVYYDKNKNFWIEVSPSPIVECNDIEEFIHNH